MLKHLKLALFLLAVVVALYYRASLTKAEAYLTAVNRELKLAKDDIEDMQRRQRDVAALDAKAVTKCRRCHCISASGSVRSVELNMTAISTRRSTSNARAYWNYRRRGTPFLPVEGWCSQAAR